MTDQTTSATHPTPAIVTQAAVRRLPRWALMLLCLAYVVPGFVGREPWKSADVVAFGTMRLMAQGQTDWLAPALLGLPIEPQAWLPHWLGAGAMWLMPAWPELASRAPYFAALSLALFFVWHAVFRFALLPAAQPVQFAFGGQALPIDYARALADSGLLALLACLGLAQIAHEATPDTFQLMAIAALLYVVALTGQRKQWSGWSAMGWVAGLLTLGLSGQPMLAVAMASGVPWLLRRSGAMGAAPSQVARLGPFPLVDAVWLLGVGVSCGAVALLVTLGDQPWPPHSDPASLAGMGRLLAWFAWPVWPLAIWTVWRWRLHLHHGHLAVPLLFAVMATGASLFQGNSDRVLMLALPALSVLAAFALPTLRRSVSSLIDWFSVLFFSFSAAVIWVVWVAMVTGYPSQPAANVARLAPGFVAEFETVAFVVAAGATLLWLRVVVWRLGKHPPVIWKSLVLPATGGVLCWLLLMTLWLPLLDFGRSYGPIARKTASLVAAKQCVEAQDLTQAQLFGLMYHGQLDLRRSPHADTCAYLIKPAVQDKASSLDVGTQWALKARLNRLNDRRESLLLYTRVSASPHPVSGQAAPADEPGQQATAK